MRKRERESLSFSKEKKATFLKRERRSSVQEEEVFNDRIVRLEEWNEGKRRKEEKEDRDNEGLG